MSKVIITPEMLETIAKIQEHEFFSSFKNDIDDIIDNYLLSDGVETNDLPDLRNRVGLVKQLRFYSKFIYDLFPSEENNINK